MDEWIGWSYKFRIPILGGWIDFSRCSAHMCGSLGLGFRYSGILLVTLLNAFQTIIFSYIYISICISGSIYRFGLSCSVLFCFIRLLERLKNYECLYLYITSRQEEDDSTLE